MVYEFSPEIATNILNWPSSYGQTQLLNSTYNTYNITNCTPANAAYPATLTTMYNIYTSCISGQTNTLRSLLSTNYTAFSNLYANTDPGGPPFIVNSAISSSTVYNSWDPTSTVFADSTTNETIYTLEELQNDMLTFINGNTSNVLNSGWNQSSWEQNNLGVVNQLMQDLQNNAIIPTGFVSGVDVTITFPSLYSNGFPTSINSTAQCSSSTTLILNDNQQGQTGGTNSNILSNYLYWLVANKNIYYTPTLTSCAYNNGSNENVQLSGSSNFQFTNYNLILQHLMKAMQDYDKPPSGGTWDNLKEAIAFGISMQFICTVLISPGIQNDIENFFNQNASCGSGSSTDQWATSNTCNNNWNTSWNNIGTVIVNFTLHVVYQIYSVVFSLSACSIQPQPVLQPPIYKLLGSSYQTANNSCITAIQAAQGTPILQGTSTIPGMVSPTDLMKYCDEMTNQWNDVSGSCSGYSVGTTPYPTVNYTIMQQTIDDVNTMAINSENAYIAYNTANMAAAEEIQPKPREPSLMPSKIVNANTESVISAYSIYLDGLIEELTDMLNQLEATGISRSQGSSTIVELDSNSIFAIPYGDLSATMISIEGFPLSQQLVFYMPRGPPGNPGASGPTGSRGKEGEDGKQGPRGEKGPTETPIQYTAAYGFIPQSPYFADSTKYSLY
jgi:hypothetical protein